MSERLSLALRKGIVALPDGPLLIIGASKNSELSEFDPARTRFLARDAETHEHLDREGWDSDPLPGDGYAGAVIFVPRARDAARAYLRLARGLTDGPIIVDGPKTNGVDALYREVRDRADVSEAWSKAHGKVFTVSGGAFEDWPDITPTESPDGWWRAPGVFSADGIDKASALLAAELPAHMAGEVADLGAGWGYLSDAILRRDGVTAVHLIEADLFALEAARRNIDDPRARFHWADARGWRSPDGAVDHVVTNPPFHTGRASDPALGRAFIGAAAAMLKPKGSLWLVANRHLPYEDTLEDAFHSVQSLTPNPSFKLFHATSPRRARKG